MKPCVLGPFQEVERHFQGRFGRLLFLPRRDKDSPLVGLHMFGTSDELNLSGTDMTRLVCHALIEMLAERGLSEAVESLVGMVRFYATPSRPALPEPEPVRIPARFAGRYTAPVHSLPED